MKLTVEMLEITATI